MALVPGARLGVYEVTAQIGEGGMGQVFRARDTRLNRDVALKVLPDSFANDADRLARFTREAQTLASLNHPHIAHIHGLEESGGMTALVMELVEGEDLSQRIARGAIPLDEALLIARQIAEALEAAHEQGIIHRDLKPANIKVRADGTVKVLDFGLAKAMDPAGPSSGQAMNSPTITTPAMTQAGIILGTAAYMAPEQARGRPLDRRADIWSFGVVLFEVLSGRRVFEGETIPDVLAKVIEREPDWNALPVPTPLGLRRLLTRCLKKDPKARMRDIGEARLQIEELLSGAPDEVSVPALPLARSRGRRALPWAVVGPLALALMLVLWAPWRRPAAGSPVTRTTITTSGPAALRINGSDRDLALSRDGRHVVYVGVGNNGTQLFVRALDALEPVAIASGVVLRGPFFSPDGQWVGFSSAGNTLQKVAITGGPPMMLASLDGGSRGATWTPDATVIFATSNPSTGLQRVSAVGGTPEVLTRPDQAQGEADHLWPEILPGGHTVLFTITAQAGGLETAQVAVCDLRTGTYKVLLRGGSHAHYVASGHLVYVAAGTLRAIPFDPNRLETRGTAVPVLPQLATTSTGTGDFAVATDGTLVYVDAPDLAPSARTLVWVDRTGKEEAVAAPPRPYLHPRLSPDGTRVALTSRDQEDDLWIWDLRRAMLTRLTADQGQDQSPVWTPNERIIFSSNRGGQLNLWWQGADGAGAAERLATSTNPQFATGITPSGTAVVFYESTQTMGRELMQLALDGTGRVTTLLPSKFDEQNGVVSPEGRWLA